MDSQPQAGIPILLVEDNGIDVEITRRVLAKAGVAVIVDVAHDGSEALDLLFSRREEAPEAGDRRLPRLVLLDLRLPNVGGLEVLRRIKNDPVLCTIPVAVLTGSVGERPMLESIEQGGNMYFVKPMTVKDAQNLLPAVEQYWVVIERLQGKRAEGGRVAVNGDYVTNVLLVEDNPDDVAIIERMAALSQTPIRLTVTGDGWAALTYVLADRRRGAPEAETPDIILLDLGLPGIQGTDVLRLLKTNAAASDIPIVLLTGCQDERQIRRTGELGAHSYMLKPMSADDFAWIARSVGRYRRVLRKVDQLATRSR